MTDSWIKNKKKKENSATKKNQSSFLKKKISKTAINGFQLRKLVSFDGYHDS